MKLDISHPLEPIFTNGLAFYEAIVAYVTRVHPPIIRIATYNTSTNDEYIPTVKAFVAALCASTKDVHLLVGVNPFNTNNIRVTQALDALKIANPNLVIRKLERVHTKCILTSTGIGYAGSLNLIHPTLDDLMVKLSPVQFPLVERYFLELWNKAPQAGIVQKLNITS